MSVDVLWSAVYCALNSWIVYRIYYTMLENKKMGLGMSAMCRNYFGL